MKLKDFEYFLPPELIAQEPLEKRDASRLMVLKRNTGEILHCFFRDIVSFLPENSLMIVNNSKVIPARVYCYKPGTGGKVEVLLTRRHSEKMWEGMIRPSKRVPEGIRLKAEYGGLEIVAGRRTEFGTRMLELDYSGDFWELLEKCGETPLPPYIKKKLLLKSRYQTIYASDKGSVAAPTAGLHFTEEIISELKNSGVETEYVTLHIGPGTFRAVTANNPAEHKMESEYYKIPLLTAEKIHAAKASKRNIAGVGTTAVRTIESVFGKNCKLRDLEGRTDLFIYPGYEFGTIDIMVTNFHLPCSTLLMLVCAFAGKEFVFKAYEEAVKERYRFYSFGDAMLIL